MGAAPRYCGSNEPCRFMVPFGGIFQTTSGNILKATTICTSALSDLSSTKNSGFFNFSGCKTFKLCSRANFLTADSFNFCPLPAGLSGAVITPTISKSDSKRAFKDATAKSGVPINTILIFCYSYGYNKYFFLIVL